MRGAVYNENNPAAAHVLRHMIKIGVIAPGVVDDRSIVDVGDCDYDEFSQVHLFAGGGFWSIAARYAGWHDERFLWSASCPCQPYSSAGKGGGDDDPRNLWPHVFRLIRSRRQRRLRIPPIVGEQVASRAGIAWFDGVHSDLESQKIAARSIVFPACAVNAPHQRLRQYWAAIALEDADRARQEMEENTDNQRTTGSQQALDWSSRPDDYDGRAVAIGSGQSSGTGFCDSEPSGIGNSITANGHGRDMFGLVHAARIGRSEGVAESGVFKRFPAIAGTDAPISQFMGDAVSEGLQGFGRNGDASRGSPTHRSVAASDGGELANKPVLEGQPSTGEFARYDENIRNPWSDSEWIVCHDGKARRTKPGIRLLVNGLPGRVDLWSIAGNAIVPEAAIQVIKAMM